MSRSRFQTFVALRYLMAHPMHVSWLALIVAGVAAAAGGVLLAVAHFAFAAPDPRALVPTVSPAQQVLAQIGSVALIVAGVCVYVFLIRVFFTFYSTVSIVGVSDRAAAALVTVLSVMNGFEADLRQKILGSNAHIQITKEDGEFTEWAELRATIDRVPGVVASTPFATSEVVIAASGNYANVVIKGIDPASAVNVTSLRSFLEDPSALERLDPLMDGGTDIPVVEPAAPPAPDAIDPAPDDLPAGGDPIDFSDPSAGPVVDPAPEDFADGAAVDPDARPRDLSGAVTDDPRRASARIATLSGVLVGRELVKQIHLYTGQEVRLVSPLADPMNPDANGTPIPFNRDYRVAGQFFTGMYEYDLKLVYVSLDSFQSFLRLGDGVDGIEVRVTDPDQVDVVVDRLSRALGPSYRVAGWRELNRNLFSALKLEKIAMFIILGDHHPRRVVLDRRHADHDRHREGPADRAPEDAGRQRPRDRRRVRHPGQPDRLHRRHDRRRRRPRPVPVPQDLRLPDPGRGLLHRHGCRCRSTR
jgi:ABC-type lipoprotein release transport system permease subunit